MPIITNTVPTFTTDNQNSNYVSEADYWEHYYEEADIHYEWNNGSLEEKPMSDYRTIQTYLWFIELLRRFLAVQQIADLTAIEMGFRMQLPGKTVIRKPDLGVIRRDNPIRPQGNVYKGTFDLCIEALSDSNTANRQRDQITKRDEYAAAGIPEFFILHHKPRYQAFYTINAQGIYTPIAPQDGVINSLVLPGFRFRSADLARCPNIDSLRTDPVYQTFVATGWQDAEAMAEAEWERAEAEQKLAKDATQRAERLAAQLRAMGIDPDAL